VGSPTSDLVRIFDPAAHDARPPPAMMPVPSDAGFSARAEVPDNRMRIVAQRHADQIFLRR
jgi:hypothetical protein